MKKFLIENRYRVRCASVDGLQGFQISDSLRFLLVSLISGLIAVLVGVVFS